MEKDKIHTLVANKNADLERVALRNAEDIIEQISNQQGVIEKAQNRIVELRKELFTQCRKRQGKPLPLPSRR